MAKRLLTSRTEPNRGRRRILVMTHAAVASAIVLVAVGCAVAPARREAGPPKMEGPNLAAIHDASSPEFNRACLDCHADVMQRTTLNPKLKDAHAAMVRFMPGYDTKVGVTNENCVSCHGKVDVIQHSGMSLRKNVDVSGCQGCHNNTGPAPAAPARPAKKKFYAN
jgi:hypothetical protein